VSAFWVFVRLKRVSRNNPCPPALKIREKCRKPNGFGELWDKWFCYSILSGFSDLPGF
jgi:hypothetical protein